MDTTEVIYKDVCPTDWESLKRIGSEALPVKYPDNYWQELCGNHDMYFTMGAFRDQELLGVVAIVKDCATSFNPSYMRTTERDIVLGYTKAAYISCLVVAKEERRKGIGSQLMNHAMALLENDGTDVFYLHVLHSNARAMALYEKIGFQNEELIRNYYTINLKREDAYLYVRRLCEPLTVRRRICRCNLGCTPF